MNATDVRASSPAAVPRPCQTPGTSARSIARQTSSERRFYSGFSLAMLVCVLIGFARSFYLKPVLFPDFPVPPEAIFIVHGFVFSAWLLLLIAQTTLIATGNVQQHRSFGTFGAVLAMVMVPMGVYVGLVAAHRPGGFISIPIPPLQFLIVPLASIVLFAIFVVLAVVRLRDAQVHKRMMLLGTLQLVTPGIARWPGLAPFGPLAFFGLTDVFVIALAIFDFRTRGRLHPATLWAGALTIVAQPVQLALSGTEAWLTFARWATGMLG
ncbi:MAG: hypothetical protein ACJ8R9_25910 [Steroidobacteraceae bacterium]